MQVRYVFSETGTGLRRNLSMTIALVVTIFVSLTLVGMGLLLNAQAHKAEQYWGSKLQITVFMCNQNDTQSVPRCASGEATQAQRAAIQDILSSHAEVASYHAQSKGDAYRIWKRVYVRDKTNAEAYRTVRAKDMHSSYWVKLKDPNKFERVKSAVEGMDGVASVRDMRTLLKPIYFWMSLMKWGAVGIAGFLLVAAVLQVGNTIRLAAFARRREIGIMRLVGASSLYIQLPFLLESLVAALVGVALASATLLAFMYFVIYRMLRPTSNIVAWVDWGDGLLAVGWISVIGLLLSLVPTLLMTRKYLKV